MDFRFGTLALCVLSGAASAATQAGSADPLQPFTLTFEVGSSAVRCGLALRASGAEPFAPIWLQLEGAGGFTHALRVRSDAGGCFEHVWLDWPCGQGLSARAATPAPGGLAFASASATGAHAQAQPSLPQSGKLVVTEIMKDPKFVGDTAGEWIEIANFSAQAIDLTGWVLLDDGSDLHVISPGSPLLIVPGQHLVLARNGDPLQNGGVQAAYVYSGFTLSNGADVVRLVEPGGALSDRVAYDDGIFWPDTAGKSLSLSGQYGNPTHNDDPSHWCEGSQSWSAGNPDLGSPGMVNSICP